MKHVLVGSLCVVLILRAVSEAAAGETLESRLMPLIKAHKGKVAVAVKHLETGESFS
jgi:hypothetical protein